MIRRFILLSFSAVFCFHIWGQNSQTVEINKIKMDLNYLNVTGTSMNSEEESSKNAQIMLAAEIETWLKDNAKEDVAGYTAKANQCIEFIHTQIGSLHRTFAYVKKTDILPYYKGDVIISNNSQIVPVGNNNVVENEESTVKKETVSEKNVVDDVAVVVSSDNQPEKKSQIGEKIFLR